MVNWYYLKERDKNTGMDLRMQRDIIDTFCDLHDYCYAFEFGWANQHYVLCFKVSHYDMKKINVAFNEGYVVHPVWSAFPLA